MVFAMGNPSCAKSLLENQPSSSTLYGRLNKSPPYAPTHVKAAALYGILKKLSNQNQTIMKYNQIS
jgi:hypothetical protein